LPALNLYCRIYKHSIYKINNHPILTIGYLNTELTVKRTTLLFYPNPKSFFGFKRGRLGYRVAMEAFIQLLQAQTSTAGRRSVASIARPGVTEVHWTLGETQTPQEPCSTKNRSEPKYRWRRV